MIDAETGQLLGLALMFVMGVAVGHIFTRPDSPEGDEDVKNWAEAPEQGQ